MKKRILLTDDDTELLSELSEILTDEGYDVRTAQNGQAALNILGRHEFDLLILDLNMPVKSGYDVIKTLDDGLVRIKTIVLTGNAPCLCETDEKQAILQLADSVISKPFDTPKLLEKIAHYTGTA